jgi:hypothetical protein
MRSDEPWVLLATRVPKTLHRRLKLYSVRTDATLMAFVVAAIEEKLRRERGRGRQQGASEAPARKIEDRAPHSVR